MLIRVMSPEPSGLVYISCSQIPKHKGRRLGAIRNVVSPRLRGSTTQQQENMDHSCWLRRCSPLGVDHASALRALESLDALESLPDVQVQVLISGSQAGKLAAIRSAHTALLREALLVVGQQERLRAPAVLGQGMVDLATGHFSECRG